MDVFIVCPRCGATVPSRARVSNVRVDADRLLVTYAQEWADHVCEESA